MSRLSSTFILLGLLIVGVRSASNACTKSYTVKSGDTCDDIAVAQGVSSYQVSFLNGGGNVCDSLFVGQSLCLVTSAYNCQPVYTIVDGDDCWDVANSHGIDLDQFLADNPQLDPNSCPIYAGLSVCVSPNGGAPSSPSAAPTSTSSPVSTKVPTSSSTVAASSPTSTGCTKFGTVNPGDDCDVLAARYNISSYNIQQINPPNTCSTLQAGASICIDSPQNNCSATYVVDGSEGCFDIAQDHNIPLDELYSLNPNVDSVDCTNIYFGEVLCVAPRASSGPSPTTSVPASSRSASATVSSTSSAATPTSTACTKFGTIQAGDDCDVIAARYNVSIYNLQKINPPNTCSNLLSGTSICIDSPLNNCSSVYVVDGSEGCFDIAQDHNIPLDELYSLNPNVDSVDCTNIYQGEVLCVAPRASGPAPPVDMDCTRNYTIVIGDTCTSIAAKNSLTNIQLTQLNGDGFSCDTLIAGQSICSFNPSLSICPDLVKVAVNDTCFSLAQSVELGLEEWEGLNPGIDCDALLPGSVVCSAEGNATLPTAPSGTNPTSLPLCGNYDKTINCCTMYSVSADLHSDMCLRANGCQDNCADDPGVKVPPSASTPTTTLIITTDYPTPTPTNNCNNCTDTQCCSAANSCEDADSWYCQSANGCKTNCDNGPAPWVSPPWQVVYPAPQYIFPSGNYSSSDGNPCISCSADDSLLPSPSDTYCCTQNVQCMAIEQTDCLVSLGCLYNCVDVSIDYDACENEQQCDPTTSTVLQPWATITANATATDDLTTKAAAILITSSPTASHKAN